MGSTFFSNQIQKKLIFRTHLLSMKKKFLFAPMVAGLLFAGCKKETPIQNPSSVGQVSETFDLRSSEISIHEQVGILHNQYVDAYYDELNAKIYQIGYNALNSSHVRNAFRKSVSDGIEENNQLRNKVRDEFTSIQSMQNPDAVVTYITNEINASTASTTFKSWAIDFMNTARTLTTDKEIAEFIEQGKKDVLQFSGVEFDVALSAVYTFQYSVEYWAVNTDKWQDLVDPNNEVPNQTRASYGGIDAGGAVAGGMWGAVVGGTATLGTLSGPSWAVGAIGGGLGSTIGAAVADFWTWIWG
jgi:hypothetical protein